MIISQVHTSVSLFPLSSSKESIELLDSFKQKVTSFLTFFTDGSNIRAGHFLETRWLQKFETVPEASIGVCVNVLFDIYVHFWHRTHEFWAHSKMFCSLVGYRLHIPSNYRFVLRVLLFQGWMDLWLWSILDWGTLNLIRGTLNSGVDLILEQKHSGFGLVNTLRLRLALSQPQWKWTQDLICTWESPTR